VEPADGPIHLREFLLADRPIFLAANASEEPVQAAFHLEREVEAGTVRVMFERRRLEVADRTFQDEFPPLGTHAYEVTDRKPGNGG
jgi:hypothetical protein